MATALTYIFKSYESLSKDELYACLWLRDRVFVVGQKITAISEIDGDDPRWHHLLGYDPTGALVGYARLLWSADPVLVGRIAIDTDRQGEGLGTELMQEVHRLLGERGAAMHAQAYLKPWYEQLGWRVCGPPFLEAQIDHLPMERS
jgi:ElaA protein